MTRPLKNCAPKALAFAVSSLAMAVTMDQAVAQEGLMLEEVVVTAQKRAQSLNDVGIAVNAYSGEQMKELGLSTAADIALQTPGFAVTNSGGGGVPVYTIRGIGFDDFSSNSSSTVGVYVDEVALPYPVMSRGAQFDIERVEVLKGPQGDLYGRNNTGGAVNFIANKPSQEFEAGVSLDYGRYDYLRAEGFVSGGLTDTVAGRLAVSSVNQGDGWQRHEVTGETNGEREELAMRALVDWQVSDQISVLFNLHGFSDDSDTQVPQSYLSFDPAVPVVSDLNDINAARWGNQPEREVDSWGGSVTVNWDLESFTLTSISAYDRFEREESIDWDGADVFTTDTRYDTEIKSFSQELRLSSNSDGDLSWIAGLYYSDDNVEETAFGLLSDLAGFDNANLVEQDTQTQALYGHVEWQLADQWRLTLGARYTDEEREANICTADIDGNFAGFLDFIESVSGGGFGWDYLPGSAAVAQGCTTLASTGATAFDDPTVLDVSISGRPFSDEINTTEFTGKIGLDYLPNEDWLIYGSVGTGFKSGGFNAFLALLEQQFAPYKEETLTAYELGFKGTLLDNRMQLNGALFYYDYEDKQVSDVVADPTQVFGVLTQIKNVPESEVQGAELELQWLPLEGLNIRAAATWLDSEVKDFEDAFDLVLFAPTDASGNELTQTPELSYNLLASYEWGIGEALLGRITLDYSHSDEYYSYLSNNEQVLVEDYDLVNARLSLSDAEDRWSVSLWGKNLGDEEYVVSNTIVTLNLSRYTAMGPTYGVSFNYNWF